MKESALITILILVFMIGAALPGTGDETDTVKTTSESVELEAEVIKIFGKSCAASTCHGGEHPKMQLSLEADSIPANLVGVPSRQNDELMLIDTKDPSQSYLLIKMTGGEGMKGKKMPVMKAPLTEDELATVTAWIGGFAEVAPLSAPNINLHLQNEK